MSIKHYANQVQSAERAAKAAEMRCNGYSLRAIAKELGVSHTQAARYLENFLDDIKADTREELQRVTLEHYQSIIDAYNPAAMQGDIDAVNTVLKAREAIRKLFALDLPTQSIIDTNTPIEAPRIIFTDPPKE